MNELTQNKNEKEKKRMDYKSVIEEQIQKLQEVQNNIIKNANTHMAPDSCKVAETIARLCEQARYMPYEEEGSTEVNPQPEETTALEEMDSSLDSQNQSYDPKTGLYEGQRALKGYFSKD